MANEIERKFLVNNEISEIISNLQGIVISQGYLNTDPSRTVRVRQKGIKGFFTVKGLQVGISKPEYEYEIPVEDVKNMMKMCEVKIEKIRYELKTDNDLVWEIDVFKGDNEGLIVAEIELPSEETKFKIPSWLGKEVSEDLRFANSILAKNPYKNWTDDEKQEIEEWKLLNPEIEVTKLTSQIVASCTCMTKTPDITYHKDDCKYKGLVTKINKLKI